MKRIEIIDSLRGIAILAVLFFHGDYYWGKTFTVAEYNKYLQNPLSMIALTFGKFAGIFAVITGMAYAFSAFYKVDKQGKPSSVILKSTFISGLWIIIISKIQSIFLDHPTIGDPTHPYPTGPHYYTLITGSIEMGKLEVPPHYLIYYYATPLLMIGLAAIWSGVLLTIIFRGDGYKHHKRNFITLFIIGTVIIMLSQVMKDNFRSIWLNSVIHDHVLKGVILGIFVGDSFPFFPYAGYATYGILFGMAFYLDIRPLYVNICSLIAFAGYMGGGIFLYTIYGYPNITSTYESPDLQMNFIQIGSFILFCFIIYNIHHFSRENRVRRAFNSLFLRRFGLMTLTIFMLEPLVGWTIKTLIMDPLFGLWYMSIVNIVLYSFGLVIVWYFLIILWEKKDFIGTWEWINAKAIQYLSRQPTMRLAIHDNLYYHEDNL